MVPHLQLDIQIQLVKEKGLYRLPQIVCDGKNSSVMELLLETLEAHAMKYLEGMVKQRVETLEAHVMKYLEGMVKQRVERSIRNLILSDGHSSLVNLYRW
uniref:Uncharacterized protein n=1 Tax=Tanacetum cinerariifolium TaxID=118510 RepID=A0A6L2NN40_TANCI|nr:hypothetical protein [Tanacetum cinerariifolium]